MVRQSDFPDEWQQTCDGGVRVEVLVFDEDGENWIEIPTTDVELWVNKDGVADIQRTAKVQFPTEWAGADVLGLISGFRSDTQDPFSFARILFNNEQGDYVVSHFGFVGGAGRGGEPGESKMWVYDMAKLLGGISASFSFDNPRPQTVLNAVARTANRQTPVQFVTPVIVGPDSHDEYLQFAEFFTARKSPIGFGDEASSSVRSADKRMVNLALADGELTEAEKKDIDDLFETITLKSTPDDKFFASARNFKRNRHSLLDVIGWAAETLNAKWHFEPTLNGVALTMDISYDGRPFAQKAVVKNEFAAEDKLFRTVRVIKNEALFDINPVNTIVLQGDVGRGIAGDVLDPIDNFFGDKFIPSKRFPRVKVRATNLYARTAIRSGSDSRAELAPPIVESKATDLEGATREAKRALREAAGEQAEGKIELFGDPYILPFDSIDSYPTCQNIVANAQIPPIRYEVEEVKHRKAGGGAFTTELRVSVLVDEDAIEVVERDMIDLQTGNVIDN